jgi:hypothetical protein
MFLQCKLKPFKIITISKILVVVAYKITMYPLRKKGFVSFLKVDKWLLVISIIKIYIIFQIMLTKVIFFNDNLIFHWIIMTVLSCLQLDVLQR